MEFVSRRPVVCWVLFTVSIMLAASHQGVAQPTPAGNDPPGRGIRHELYMAVRAEPDSPLLKGDSSEQRTATLTVTMRVSAHSREANFFGKVPTIVSGFDLSKGSKEQKVWEDAACHHERGLPKFTVTDVSGAVSSGDSKVAIFARQRILGMLLPGDEVTQSRRIGDGTDDISPFILTRTDTRQSRISVEVRLRTRTCDLGR